MPRNKTNSNIIKIITGLSLSYTWQAIYNGSNPLVLDPWTLCAVWFSVNQYLLHVIILQCFVFELDIVMIDEFIVFCCSLVELFQGGAGGLSVLRTFRLLRILKLVRFLPALRYQLIIMLKTMDNVATFFALLVLFIFIFRFVWCYLFSQNHLKMDSHIQHVLAGSVFSCNNICLNCSAINNVCKIVQYFFDK